MSQSCRFYSISFWFFKSLLDIGRQYYKWCGLGLNIFYSWTYTVFGSVILTNWDISMLDHIMWVILVLIQTYSMKMHHENVWIWLKFYSPVNNVLVMFSHCLQSCRTSAKQRCMPYWFSALIYIWATARQNQQNDLCAQRRLRSACASAQSDRSLHCTLKGKLRTQFFHADLEDSDPIGLFHRELVGLSLVQRYQSNQLFHGSWWL